MSVDSEKLRRPPAELRHALQNPKPVATVNAFLAVGLSAEFTNPRHNKHAVATSGDDLGISPHLKGGSTPSH